MRVVVLLLLACLAAPRPAAAWGFEAHRLIMDRAINLLPAALRPLFEARRAYVVERSIDPDLWRNAGWTDEDPNHFVDLDNGAFGPPPFPGLPRDYADAVQKFGKPFIDQQGRLPWRVQEFYGKLQREFESLGRQPAPGYALDNIVYYAAIVSHYVSDGHVPLHAAANFDGQLTGQNGLHSRWEAELFERNRAALRVSPAAGRAVSNPRDFMFDTLIASQAMVGELLAADKAAVAGRESYDDGYFEAFGKAALPGLERRLNDSIAAVAAVIAGAWEQAGRPGVPTELPRTPRRVRRPNP